MNESLPNRVGPLETSRAPVGPGCGESDPGKIPNSSAGLFDLPHQVGEILTRGGLQSEVLHQCCHLIVLNLGAAFARIWILNDATLMLEMQASAGMYTHLDGAHGRVPLGELKIGLIAAERKSHLTNQVIGDPGFDDQEWARREGMVAFAGYPLMFEDRLVGVVALFARHVLADETLQALGLVANMLSLGIERKRAIESLSTAQERLQYLVSSSPAMIYSFLMTEGEVEPTWVSDNILQMTGYPKDEAMTLEWWNARVHPEDGKRIMAELARPFINDRQVTEYRFRHKVGNYFWVRDEKIQLRDENGLPLEIIGSWVDITARKQAEEEMTEKDALIRIAGKVTRSGGWAVEMPNQQVSWSDEVFDILEYPRGSVPPLAEALALYPEPWREKVTAAMEACSQHGTGFDMEVEIVTVKGRRIWVRLCAEAVRDNDGAVTRVQGAFQDINESKRREEELKWKSAFLEAQVNSSSDGILVVDHEGRRILQNQQTVDLFRIPPAVTGDLDDARQIRWVTSLVRDPEKFAEKVAYLNSHPDETSHDEIELKDGTIVDRYSSPVVGSDGARYGRIWTFRNITGRKQDEKALRENEERFSGAFEYAPIGVALISMEGAWLKVNRALCALTGYSREELLQLNFRDITCAEDMGIEAVPMRQLTAGEISSYQLEKSYVHKLGHLVPILVNASIVRDSKGASRYFIGQIQDITERRRNEELLRLLGSAVKQSREAIMITDAVVDLPGPKILFVNPAFTTMTGYTAEEVVGKTPRILQGPATDRKVLDRLRGNLERGEGFEGETVNYRKDGAPFQLEWQIAPIRNSRAQLTHFVGVQRDVTERRKLENQVFQSQKMETVGRMAGGIAHEFNSILSAIIGQSELLLADLPPASPLTHNVTEISRAAGRAAGLIRQLLAYGRKQFLLPETLDLNRVLADMEGMLRHLAGDRVELRVLPAPGLQFVMADAGQIEQVIANLVINAIDAMPNGGKLTLETNNIVLDDKVVGGCPELKAGGYVMMGVTDTGKGMSDLVKSRLFDPFFTTKEVGKGTGLGLSTCYGIIKQSGGHISVYSELARGSTFKIYLPRVERGEEVEIKPIKSPDLPQGTESILLVEDDPALRNMASTLLRRLGYKVLAASNGIEALNRKQQGEVGHIDLLLTDVVMPHMSGKELADRIQAISPYTKILFTSAYTENAIVCQGALNEGVALLQKPFTPSGLALKIREVLDHPAAEEFASG